MQSADSDQEFPEKAFSNRVFSEDEKFELLSAYLDGEVTETEYQLVIGWIASDRKVAQHYQKQLKLRQALQSLSPGFLASARASKHLSSEQMPSSQRASDDKPKRNQFSRNAYAPHKLTRNQPPIHHGQISNSQFSNSQISNQLSIAMCNLATSNTSWRQVLLVMAVLGATAITLSTETLGNRRRPINFDRLKEPLSGQTPRRITTAVGLENQQPLSSPFTRSIRPVFTSHRKLKTS